jgi:CubicO group peptidase (beta-lactamase class C family)
LTGARAGAQTGAAMRTLSAKSFLPIIFFLLLSSYNGLGQHPRETQPRSVEEKPAGAAATPAPAPAMTAADVEAFLDGVVPVQLERDNIAGAVVCVVKDGQVLFEKGYGYADREKKVKVSATDTLFRPGSISKLFTWTSVMQLQEQGKLDLDGDVNQYLDFKIPAAYGQPITLRNLMTHTPGFAEGNKDLISSDAAHIEPLGPWLQGHVPPRIFAPGTVPAYSNYGAALAGYIVQRVSGEPFEQYVEEHILKPLRMDHSSFRQPLPKELEPLMSKGYKLGSDKPKPYEFIPASPAGSMAVTADDISRFMLAHLGDGRWDEVQILRAETAQLMHARQRSDQAQMNGMALGFYEESRNGHRIIGHGGDTQWFHSDLHLMPDQKLGFFVSYNSVGRSDVSPRGVLWRRFLDRYYPYTPAAVAAPATAAADGRAVAGNYLVSRRCDTCILKLAYLAAGEVKIASEADGTLVSGDLKGPNGQPIHWKEIAPLLYPNADGQDQIAFVKGSDGRYNLVVGVDIVLFQGVPWYQSKGFALLVMAGTLGILALTLLLWLIAALVRWHYGRKLELTGGERALRLAAYLACGLQLAVLAGWAVFFSKAATDLDVLSAKSNGWLHLLQVLGIAGLVAGVIPLVAALRAWLRGGTWWWTRVHYTLLLLATVGYAWMQLAGHLLDWSLRY